MRAFAQTGDREDHIITHPASTQHLTLGIYERDIMMVVLNLPPNQMTQGRFVTLPGLPTAPVVRPRYTFIGSIPF